MLSKVQIGLLATVFTANIVTAYSIENLMDKKAFSDKAARVIVASLPEGKEAEMIQFLQNNGDLCKQVSAVVFRKGDQGTLSLSDVLASGNLKDKYHVAVAAAYLLKKQRSMGSLNIEQNPSVKRLQAMFAKKDKQTKTEAELRADYVKAVEAVNALLS